MWPFLLPLSILFSSFATGVFIFALREDQVIFRTVLNMAGAVLKVLLVGLVLWGTLRGDSYESRIDLAPGLDLLLRVDMLSLLFVSLSAVLWLVTTLYAIGYLEGSSNRSRFFGFFSISVTATTGVALAGNLFTFFLFYEILTISTYPLVVHRGTRDALQAGRTYLYYTLTGGAVFLLGVVWMHILAGPTEFVHGGALHGVPADQWGQLRMIFPLLLAGLGVKAALVPLHGWLPRAMVAPAPVSALLHAVAVVKAGAFGIVRTVYDVYGPEFAHALGLLTPLAVIASVTIVYGSLRALAQDEIKKRLAYSTVSQLSYIVLGAAVLGPVATMGGLVHLVHQGIMKITLFFCAGILAETLGVSRVSEAAGVGRRMPVTMAAFTIAALGMIGLPPIAGFISKWHLGLGGVGAGQMWVVGVLLISSLLNAMYFLPVLHAAWFGRRARPFEPPRRPGSLETRWTLLLPAVVTAALSLAAGLFAATEWSPLELTRLIAERMYGLE